MAALDGNTMRRMARLYCVDYDESGTNGTPTDPAAPDATYDRVIEEVYRLYAERVEPRFQRVSATASGLTMTGLYTATTTLTTIAEIAGAEYGTSGAGATSGFPMERLEVREAIQALADLGYTYGAGAPYRWAAERIQTDTEASQGKWNVYLDQQHNNGSGAVLQVILIARLEPAAIGGTTGTPDVSEIGSYTIAKIAAAKIAAKIGEDQEFIANILADVSETVKASMGLIELAKKPRIRELERA